jgi:A/G-specific adenine glycosylase
VATESLPSDVAETIDAARAALLAGFDPHRRAMPWRATADPYAIWVSEVMLQQTRVETVIPYYTRFIARFPTVRALADADEPAVLALWSGLGYYRRARMLHAGARHVVSVHQGVMPSDPAMLLGIPGVGPYTAGAIASIAFGLPEPVLDGNVERVLSRLFAIEGDPRGAAVRARLWSLARAFATHPRPGEVNQSLMELGATVCTPSSPRCMLCPARPWCAAQARGEPARFPEKAKKRPPRVERWTAHHVRDARGHVLLGPPPAGLDRWNGMLLPPLDQGRSPAALAPGGPLATITHVLTHARMEVSIVRADLLRPDPDLGTFIDPAALDALPIPAITRVILEAAAQALDPAPIEPPPAPGTRPPRSAPRGAGK